MQEDKQGNYYYLKNVGYKTKDKNHFFNGKSWKEAGPAFGFYEKKVPLFARGQGGDVAAAGFGFSIAAYWGETVITLYEMQESKNLANNMARAKAYKSVTGTVPKNMRVSISYGKTMTTFTKAAGRGFFVVGTAMSVYDMSTNPTTESLVLGSADLIMGVVSIGCPVVGLIYFSGRIIYDIASEE